MIIIRNIKIKVDKINNNYAFLSSYILYRAIVK